MKSPSTAIIIPAWNEEKTISKCLTSLLRQRGIRRFEIVVVANGCTDSTVLIATQFCDLFSRIGSNLSILEIGTARKYQALNLGDSAVVSDIRVYLDADVELSDNSLSKLMEVLDTSQPRMACPKPFFCLPQSTRARNHAMIYQHLPPMSDDAVGLGCYAVNQAGRKRWGSFPSFIADDAFVRSCFTPSERFQLKDATFSVPFPEGEELYDVLERWHRGNIELRSKGIITIDTNLTTRRIAALFSQPKLITLLPGYLYRSFRAKLKAKKNYKLKREVPWIRSR